MEITAVEHFYTTSELRGLSREHIRRLAAKDPGLQMRLDLAQDSVDQRWGHAHQVIKESLEAANKNRMSHNDIATLVGHISLAISEWADAECDFEVELMLGLSFAKLFRDELIQEAEKP